MGKERQLTPRKHCPKPDAPFPDKNPRFEAAKLHQTWPPHQSKGRRPIPEVINNQ